MNDIDGIRRNVSLVETARSFGVDLEPDGREWVAPCPFHDERTPSFTIFTGNDHVERFQCFGCDAKGDVLDFTQRIKGVSTIEAIKILSGGTNTGPNIRPVQAEKRGVYDDIEILPPPTELAVGRKIVLYNPKRAHNGNITPTGVYPYRRADGSIFAYVLRKPLPDGGKETPMVCWVRLPDGQECWARMPFPKPRMLYGLDRLKASGQVWVVEGEKCADALWDIRDRKKPVLTWAGGTHGAVHADWSALAGRDVLIWPDADRSGYAVTASKITELLAGVAERVRFIEILKGTSRARDDF